MPEDMFSDLAAQLINKPRHVDGTGFKKSSLRLANIVKTFSPGRIVLQSE